ncbi:MAG TPA: SAM-dependent methyltransferase [Trebonia sp.]|nr:SAM-dependent methyltransferase [Trebonia sp.]
MENPAAEAAVPELDTTRPHMARIYDYFLGGKNHFAADRETADQLLAHIPALRTAARENRGFLHRSVRYLVAEAGIRQFLDIGTGLPTASNVHEVAQSIAPESRVVYVDNDPMVLAHARALLTSSKEGRTAYIDADLRKPEAILSSPATREVLDFSQPVALTILATLHLVQDEDNPAQVLATFLDALAPGSYLVASHITMEHASEAVAAGQRTLRTAGVSAQARDSGEFARLAFSGLELMAPGVVLVSDWRPVGVGPRPAPDEVNLYGGVGRKPAAGQPG